MSTKKEKEQKKTVEEQTEETINNSAESIEDITPELEITEESVDSEEVADELQEKYDLLEQKNQTLQNDYLRLMAEFDNYRKRTLKEKADLLKSGGEDVIKKLLPVIDDFERAIDALEKSDDINAVKEGVNLIYNKFKAYLESNNVKEIPSIGESFDTELHEAITTFPAPTPEQKGKVIDCMTKGYKHNDKVIRYSKVVVGE